MPLDKEARQPLYRQLMEELKEQIHAGKYKAGDQIPTEPELAAIYEVSRITVRKTIEELCEQGYLVKQRGKGTFVETPKLYRKIEQRSNVSFSESCKMNGREPSSHVLSSEIIKPEKWISEFLELKNKEEVIHISRVLSADNIPIILEELYFPTTKFSGFQPAKLENASLFKYLENQFGITNDLKSRSTAEASIVSSEIAEKLSIMPGEAIMILCNYMKDQEQNPAYISKEFIVGNRYTISF